MIIENFTLIPSPDRPPPSGGQACEPSKRASRSRKQIRKWLNFYIANAHRNDDSDVVCALFVSKLVRTN
jgi:hypothetical protein